MDRLGHISGRRIESELSLAVVHTALEGVSRGD